MDENGETFFASTTVDDVGGEQIQTQPQPNPIGSPPQSNLIGSPITQHHTIAAGGVVVTDSSSSSSFNGTDFSSTSVPIYNGAGAFCGTTETSASKISNSGTTFLLAPGIERSNAAAAAVVLDYTEHFPKLPERAAPAAVVQKPMVGWPAKPAVKPVQANVVTQVFHLPAEERASRNNNRQFGNSTEEQQKCNAIASATETTIELCEAKDHTLTILITGKRVKVEEARARIIRDLQMQATREISIPKEHHRVLIGKEGVNLRQLEADTDCRIIIPGRDNASDVVKVIGPREGIEKAMHQILLISDEQSKLAQEHLLIPRMYYPWIRGPYNEVIDKLTAETGAKINIPPPSAKSEMIVVTGEKDGVHRAAKVIREIFENAQQTVKSVTCKVARAQHRYIIGSQRSGLSEILKETGVSVEVPPEDDECDTITLRGDPARLGDALTLVYAKASSVITAEVPCPAWLHKFLIGPKGATLQTIVTSKERVQVDFEEAGVIYLEGPPEDVRQTHDALTAAIQKLQAEMATEIVKVHPTYHRHVIGRGGALITKIKNETGVQITIPNEQTNSDEIRIEGKKDGVAKATADIIEIVKRIENEKSRDIVIEQRFHKQLIGTKGEQIQKLRDQFPSIAFTFPDAGRKSDIVTLRGDKNEVDKCYKLLQQQVKELLESNYQMTVPIFKDFHKHIVGKGGANVRKIREETQTRIDLPGEGSGEDKILVTGKKANVEKAVDMLTKIQNELASIVTIETTISSKLHPRLLGGGQRLIQDIQNECGGVQIRFPHEKKAPNCDKVTIRGPKDDVERAEKLLQNLAKDRELSSFEDSVTAKSEFHRFLIGRGGTRIKKIRDVFPDVRILFPRETDKDQQTIHLIGRKEEVAQVKATLEKLIVELNETVEITTDVAPKWHRHFVSRGASVLREIQDQFGGVAISFPRVNSTESKVTIKGSKQCVEGAKQRIDEIVEDLESQVSIKVDIPAEHHRALLANRGQKVQDICANYNVQIKFPDRRLRDEAEQLATNGDHTAPPGGDSSPLNTITISGRAERCEEARTALLALVPITETMPVAFEFHRYLIGRSGEKVRALMHEFDVNISIPPEDQKLDHITIQGTAENIHAAVEEIRKRVVEFEEQAEDRRLRQFKVTVSVPADYHQRLIGPRGQTINNMRAKHDVQISFPKQASTDDETPNDNVVIIGYEEKANACRDEIEAMIEQWRSLFTQEIALDARFHPRLIGQKGRTIRKIMDDYQVEIRLPRSTDPDPNLVTICGKSEDSVYDCIDHLRNIEEEYLQESLERGQYLAHRHDDAAPASTVTPHIEISNAPWPTLDTNNMEDFPSMIGGAVSATSAGGGVWGGARRF
jgi:polyribonucleotide nucleotidyltransferase